MIQNMLNGKQNMISKVFLQGTVNHQTDYIKLMLNDKHNVYLDNQRFPSTTVN